MQIRTIYAPQNPSPQTLTHKRVKRRKAYGVLTCIALTAFVLKFGLAF